MLVTLSACGTVTGSPPASAGGSATVVDASIGVCHALQQLPGDVNGSARSFQNEAHGPLHVLAATPDLDRGLSARMLEAMAKVESDISLGPANAPFQGDLQELLSATDTALRALGRVPPACNAGG